MVRRAARTAASVGGERVNRKAGVGSNADSQEHRTRLLVGQGSIKWLKTARTKSESDHINAKVDSDDNVDAGVSANTNNGAAQNLDEYLESTRLEKEERAHLAAFNANTQGFDDSDESRLSHRAEVLSSAIGDT